MDGRRQDLEPLMGREAPPAENVDLLEVPPSGLTAGQRTCWRLWAPQAIAQQTLVPSTALGFRELCEQYVMKDSLAKRITRLGPCSSDAERLLKSYVKLAQRLDATLARFKLTAMGKPADRAAGARATAAASPWAEVAR
jgi:hypothetical protein